jgi:3-methylfumaryl-CoA hydratase
METRMTDHLEPPANRMESAIDVVAPTSVAALSAMLDYAEAPGPGEPVPHLWHWIFFRSTARQSQLAADGHPVKGGFLPDLGLPRRTWAGGRLRFHAPLTVGSSISRDSTIGNVSEKTGRGGRLGFVTVKHAIRVGGALAIDEEHDIVYREPAIPGAASPAPTRAPFDEIWHRQVEPTEVLLFRYSALTFIGHRIHYDKPYATEVEGYPNLVVHGPLIATLLMDLLRRNQPQATVLDFFQGHPPKLPGQRADPVRASQRGRQNH